MSSKNNSSWSNIICDGVPREDNQWWEERNNYLDLIREIIRDHSLLQNQDPWLDISNSLPMDIANQI